MKTYKSTEIVQAIQWNGQNAGEIERIIRTEGMGSVMREGNYLHIDTPFSDITLSLSDYLIVNGALVRSCNEHRFEKNYEEITSKM